MAQKPHYPKQTGRRNRVSPDIGPGIGYNNAFDKEARMLDTVAQGFTSMGKEIATTEAVGKAQQDAIDNPNQTLRTPVTSVEKAYYGTYNEIAANVNLSEGSNRIIQLAEDVTSYGALNSESLDEYNSLVTGAIEGYIAAAPEAVRPELQLALNKVAADAGRGVASRVQEYDKQLMLGEFDSTITGYQENAQRAFGSGNVSLAKDQLALAAYTLDTAAQNRLITPVQANQGIRQLRDMGVVGAYTAEFKDRLKSGQGEQFLNHFIRNRPQWMTDDQYQQSLASMQREGSIYQSTIQRTNSTIALKIEEAIIDGNIKTQEQLEQYRKDLPPKTFLRLKKSLKDTNVKAVKGANIFDEVSNGDIEFGKYTNNDYKKSYLTQVDRMKQMREEEFKEDGFIPERPELVSKAMIASKYPIKITPFIEEVEYKVQRGTPEQRIEAFEAYRYLAETNQQGVIQQFDAPTKAALSLGYKAVTQLGYNAPDAYALVEKTLTVDASAKEERKENFKRDTKGWNTKNKWRELAVDYFDDDDLPSGLVNELESGTAFNYELLDNIDAATEQTLEGLSTTYGKNSYTDKTEYFPIDKYYELQGIPEDIWKPVVNKDLINSIDAVIPAYQERGLAFEKIDERGGLGFYKFNDRIVYPAIVSNGDLVSTETIQTKPITYQIQMIDAETQEPLTTLMQADRPNTPQYYTPERRAGISGLRDKLVLTDEQKNKKINDKFRRIALGVVQ